MGRKKAMHDKLPWDQVEEILCRLPIQSLTRFRLVCKEWNIQINDKTFVNKHLAHASQEFCLWRDSMVCSVQNPSLKLHELISQRHSSPDWKISQIAHCDGLLLCVTSNGLEIMNPCLGSIKSVESLDFKKFYSYSLGYCNKSRHGYKILRFRGKFPPLKLEERVEIYEFESDVWRHLDVTLDYWRKITALSGVSLNGTTFWLAKWRDRLEYFIQSFDFSTERFEPVCGLPFEFCQSNPTSLSVFRGDRLSALKQCNKTKKIEIWATANKIGDGVVSWRRIMTVKLHNIPCLRPRNCLLSPSYFIDKNNKLVICCCDKHKAVTMYIVGEEDFEQLHAEVHPLSCNHCYVPSLVFIPLVGSENAS